MESREEFVERKSTEMIPFMPYIMHDIPDMSIIEGKRKAKKKSRKDKAIRKRKMLSRRINRK